MTKEEIRQFVNDNQKDISTIKAEINRFENLELKLKTISKRKLAGRYEQVIKELKTIVKSIYIARKYSCANFDKLEQFDFNLMIKDYAEKYGLSENIIRNIGGWKGNKIKFDKYF